MGKRGTLPHYRRVIDALLAVAIAPRCASCDRVLDTPLGGPVCDGCWSQIRILAAPFCRTCGNPLASWRVISTALEQCPRCRRAPSPVDAARAAGHYEGTLRAIIHAFKYDGRSQLAHPLSALMIEAGAHLLRGADCVVPIPLHPWRRARRGFNQAEELARHLGVPMRRVLWRVRATAPQTALDARARRRNLDGAFSLSPFLTPRRRRLWLEGRTVVLIDDVRTTGATLEACASVLKMAGTTEVRALTVAQADLHAVGHGRSRTETAA